MNLRLDLLIICKPGNLKNERGICLNADNIYLLLDYIWQLEEGYN